VRLCEAVLYRSDLEKNLNVCPKCSHHNRITARERLDWLLDLEGRYEIGAEVVPVDSLKFVDSRRYTERLPGGARRNRRGGCAGGDAGAASRRARGRRGVRVRFLGGSMGSVVGERFVRGVQHLHRAAPAFVCFHRQRRRAHAGRPAVADADGQDLRRADAALAASGCRSSRC
jgi:acetyl-CoA carboxylase carboxyl transferase subunit beta